MQTANPNELFSKVTEMMNKISADLPNVAAQMQEAQKMLGKDKEYRFTFKGKKGLMTTNKLKIISLEITGVNDEEIREILNLLNDRPTQS
jgi:hypothetical protein